MNHNEIIERCLDNTKTEDEFWKQGILFFGKHFFPHVIRNHYSKNHYKMSQLFFELLNPERKSSMDRQAYMLIHREAAKSTISSFLMPLYLIFLKGHKPVYRRMNLGWEGGDGVNNYSLVQIPAIDEKFILIASETASQSESFVIDIKAEIESNKELKRVFGSKHAFDYDAEEYGAKRRDKKWTKSAFITNDKTAVWGIGTGQKIRGRKINGSRPTFVVVDDMYSEENTKTEERREGLSKWFYNALKNSLDSEVGKSLWLGTMVHPDIIVNDFRKDKNWFGMEIPIIGEEELNIALSECSFDENGDITLPSNRKIAEMNHTFTSMSWKERYPIEYIIKKYREQLLKQKPDYFYQEYMNKPMAPQSQTVDPEAFERHKTLKFYKNDNGEQECTYTDKNGVIWTGPVNIRIGVDMASALHKKSDDTAITVGGYARFYPSIPGEDKISSLSKFPKGKIVPVLAHIEGGKYEILQAFDNPDNKTLTVATSLQTLLKRFKVEKVIIEANGQQEQSIRAIASYLRSEGIYTPIVPQYVNTDKTQRIKATLLPIFQKYKKMICVDTAKVQTLYQQLNMLTVSDKDDYPDALEKTFVNMREPEESFTITKKESNKSARMSMIKSLGPDAWYLM